MLKGAALAIALLLGYELFVRWRPRSTQTREEEARLMRLRRLGQLGYQD